MSYILNNSNIFSIRSAIDEFKQVILVQNQVITNLQTALNASVLRVDALETTTTSNTNAIAGQASSIAANASAIAGQASSIASNTTNITSVLDEVAATNSTVLSNTTNLSTTMTTLGNMQPVVASHTASLAALQTQVSTNTSDLATKTTQISVLESISGGHTTSIGVNYNEIVRLNGISLDHATLLAGLRTDVDAVAGGGSQAADIAALQSGVSTVNTTLTSLNASVSGHTTSLTALQNQVSANTSDIAGLRTDVDAIAGSGGGSQAADIAALQSDLSTVNTTLTSLNASVSSNSSSISTVQSDLTFQSNALGTLTTTVTTQADTILGLVNDVDTLGATVSSYDSSIGSITTLTDNVNGLTSQVSTISSRSLANMLQISTSRNHIESMQPIVAGHTTSISSINTSLTDIQSSITTLEDGAGSSVQTQIDTLRTDTDANTLSNTQFLNALQYQSTSIFGIDQAIQILNGKVSILETSQVTQDDLIREFDQEFNDPVTGVLFKLDTLTTTYNTHVDGVYLTLRQNVDSNNLILGTLSTHTTSLLTAMTQVTSRVQVLEDNAPPTSSIFDLFDEYPSTNYVGGGVIQTSFNITVEEALEIGLTISNLYSIVHNVGGTTYYCAAGGSLVSGQSINRTTFVKK